MLINVRVRLYDGMDLVAESFHDVEVTSSWYTAQNYFDEHVKSELFTGYCDCVILKWRNKNYVFKRK